VSIQTPITIAPKTSTILLRQYATPATAALFAVIAITGVLMFFHIQKPVVRAAHEWLGLVFVVIAAFHVVRNWGGFANIMKKSRSQAIVAVVAIVTGVFVVANVGGGSGQGNPMERLVQTLGKAPISALAPALGLPADAMIARLRAAGITVSDANQSLADVASAQNVGLRRLLPIVLSDSAERR
jgi:hypothetical protein